MKLNFSNFLLEKKTVNEINFIIYSFQFKKN